MIKAQTVCERSIEIVGFSRYLHLLVRAHAVQGSHVMETVGQIYEQGTYIELHGCKNLPVVIYLLGLNILILLLLGNHSHEEGYIIAETFTDVLYGIVSILYHIVQEGRNDRVCSQFQLLRNDSGYTYRMDYLWFTGFTLLRAVGLAREFKSQSESVDFIAAHLLFHSLEQFVSAALDLVIVVRFHNI